MINACIVGSSGLVGGFCLNMLLQNKNYSQVINVVRKPSGVQHPKLVEIVVDFDNLDSYKNELKANHYFCCIGTTIKKAKSKENFKKVDYTYALEFAKIALSLSAQVFSIITAMGSNSNSPLFYNKVKGELEDKLRGFDIPSVNIIQPSLLLGDRAENRFAEKVSSVLMEGTSFLMKGFLKKYKAIDAIQVAKAMVAVSIQGNKGFNTYTSDKLWNY